MAPIAIRANGSDGPATEAGPNLAALRTETPFENIGQRGAGADGAISGICVEAT
jgi:hypothetical protein